MEADWQWYFTEALLVKMSEGRPGVQLCSPEDSKIHSGDPFSIRFFGGKFYFLNQGTRWVHSSERMKRGLEASASHLSSVFTGCGPFSVLTEPFVVWAEHCQGRGVQNPVSMPVFLPAELVRGARPALPYNLNVKYPHRLVFEHFVPRSGAVWGSSGTFRG